MGAIASISLADGQASPVSHTFNVQNGQQADEPARWLEKTAGSYAGFLRLAALVRRSTANRSTKVIYKVDLPTLAVIGTAANGVQPLPTVAYTVSAEVTFTLPDACSDANRKDILAYVKNLLANAAVTDNVVNMSPTY